VAVPTLPDPLMPTKTVPVPTASCIKNGQRVSNSGSCCSGFSAAQTSYTDGNAASVQICASGPVSCSSIGNQPEQCGYTPGCYWYDNSCHSVAPTGGFITVGGTPTSVPWINNKCNPGLYNGHLDSASGIWVNFNDEYTSECICGEDAYYYDAYYNYWYCGKNPHTGLCRQQCPDPERTNVLQDCVINDEDGTSRDSMCTEVKVDTCGGVTYCCPGAGGAWTTDMTNCVGVGGDVCMDIFKGKGDADRSLTTDINDASIWRSEFIEGEYGTVSRDWKASNHWRADFDCDGKVTLNDISIWRDNFIKGLN